MSTRWRQGWALTYCTCTLLVCRHQAVMLALYSYPKCPLSCCEQKRQHSELLYQSVSMLTWAVANVHHFTLILSLDTEPLHLSDTWMTTCWQDGQKCSLIVFFSSFWCSGVCGCHRCPINKILSACGSSEWFRGNRTFSNLKATPGCVEKWVNFHQLIALTLEEALSESATSKEPSQPTMQDLDSSQPELFETIFHSK